MSNMGEYIIHMTEAYLDTLIWTTSLDDGKTQMEDTYDIHDVSNEAFDSAQQTCADFIELVWEHVEGSKTLEAEFMGHNLALSQNGHGTGFWDSDLGDMGDALHKFAKTFDEQSLYVSDDDTVELY